MIGRDLPDSAGLLGPRSTGRAGVSMRNVAQQPQGRNLRRKTVSLRGCGGEAPDEKILPFPLGRGRGMGHL